MNKKLAILGGNQTISPESARFIWPKITKEVEEVILAQLRGAISIYDRSGIFLEFENNFSAYHGRKKALVTSSGTSAIYSMFVGAGITKGDEVICPAYTFFATASPLMTLGAKPVFCDCRTDGNIDPDEIRKKISKKTKALIVTHMWGIPCEMDTIEKICAENDIILLEDCSHAHGAEYKGKKVGTFGQAAAWSLQGKKIITGGEGGILLTDSDDIYHRALLAGQYNKRCRQEIPTDHPLSEFSQTGFGQKLRAHPLAIAMANQQFKQLDGWLVEKAKCAKRFMDSFGDCSFLSMPQSTDSEPSWYAFVMQYDESAAGGVSIEKFVAALQAEGLIEVDIPGSTGPIHNLPLFTSPEKAFPGMYEQQAHARESFPQAENFFKSAIKIPVWVFLEDSAVVSAYIRGFKKVIAALEQDPKPFNS